MDAGFTDFKWGPINYTGQGGKVYQASVGNDIVVRCRDGRYHIARVRVAERGRFILGIMTTDGTQVVEFWVRTGLPRMKSLRPIWEIMGPIDNPSEAVVRKGIKVANEILDAKVLREREVYWRNHLHLLNMHFDNLYAFNIGGERLFVHQFNVPCYNADPDELTDFVWFDPDGGYHERRMKNAQARYGVPLRWLAECRLVEMQDAYRRGKK
ncbi:MAG: hypothetical protein JRC86_12670 [Deltaproteobacteria bacterium]|nr:hypothetical protein [Deltaproteobacteria bacterium]